MTNAAGGLSVYDTMTGAKRPFEPRLPGRAGVYVCGATVQSSPHIGHMRAAVAFDVVRRWLSRLGYEVTFVRNVTDIDDKILDKAAAAGERWWARAYRYEREFTAAYDALGVLPPTVEPRATGHVPDMVSLIRRLVDSGHAYVVLSPDGSPSGNVYFDVASWPAYGELTHQKRGPGADAAAVEADRVGPSVDAVGADAYNPVDPVDLSPDKHDPRDFALWKAPKRTDPEDARWYTPFGPGRPGWHIECSAMSHRYLGDGFDIHGGGLDLRFPHHENEMAQTRAAGFESANYWMHSAWVTVKGEKMSKSLGNGLLASKLIADYDPWTVRYALGSVQYQSMLEWGADTMRMASAAHDRVFGFVERAVEALGVDAATGIDVSGVTADAMPVPFIDAMNDDFNVPAAIAVVNEEVRRGNRIISDGADADALADVFAGVRAMLDVLGLDPLAEPWAGAAGAGSSRGADGGEALSRLVSGLLEDRAEARAVGDYRRAGDIRDRLSSAGVTVTDTLDGPEWSL